MAVRETKTPAQTDAAAGREPAPVREPGGYASRGVGAFTECLAGSFRPPPGLAQAVPQVALGCGGVPGPRRQHAEHVEGLRGRARIGGGPGAVQRGPAEFGGLVGGAAPVGDDGPVGFGPGQAARGFRPAAGTGRSWAFRPGRAARRSPRGRAGPARRSRPWTGFPRLAERGPQHPQPARLFGLPAHRREAGHLTVSPSSGSLASSASVTITVTSTSLVALDGQLTVNPGGQTITVVLSIGL